MAGHHIIAVVGRRHYRHVVGGGAHLPRRRTDVRPEAHCGPPREVGVYAGVISYQRSANSDRCSLLTVR